MKTIIEKFNDPEKLFFEIQKRKKDVFFWIIAITIITFITIFISSQDYSFLLVLSSLTQMFAFIIVVIKYVMHYYFLQDYLQIYYLVVIYQVIIQVIGFIN